MIEIVFLRMKQQFLVVTVTLSWAACRVAQLQPVLFSSGAHVAVLSQTGRGLVGGARCFPGIALPRFHSTKQGGGEGLWALISWFWSYLYLLFCIITAQLATYKSCIQDISQKMLFWCHCSKMLTKPEMRERLFMEDFLKEMQVIHPSRLGITNSED